MGSTSSPRSIARHSRSHAGVRGPALHSARTTVLMWPVWLRLCVLGSMTTGSRITSSSQRVGSLSAGLVPVFSCDALALYALLAR